MRKFFISIVALSLVFCELTAQGVAITSNGTAAHSSAMLDIKSNNKGVLIPRVSSASRKAIANPATGLMVYDSTESTLYMFDGMRWLGFQAMPDNIRPISKLVFPPDQQDTMYAGYSVAVSNDFAVIGAPYRNIPASISGGVFIYKRNGDSWNYFSTLSPSSGALDTAAFGQSVNICGNYIIVGAPFKKNAMGKHVGAAYVFNFNGAAWVQTDIFWGSVEGNGFAGTVDISETGTHVAISEPSATASGMAGAGVIRVYNKLASWMLQASLSDPAPHVGEGFGATLAMSPAGTFIVAGTPDKTVASQQSNGVASVFSRSGSVWSHMHSFGYSGLAGVRTGALVDITNTKVLVVDGGTRKVSCFNIGAPWSTFPYEFPTAVEGASIDPVTGEFYIWCGTTIYRSGNNVAKNISMSGGNYGLPQLFSVYNDRFVIGQPGESSSTGVYGGGWYLGMVNAY
jgi:hypothetical protein